MNVEDFRLLYDYNAWADHRALEACAALNAEQFTRDLGSSFPSVRDTLLHVMQVEWLWLERWHGRSPASFAAHGDYSDVEAIRRRWLEIERVMLDYIASLSSEDVQRVVQHKTTAGVPQSQPLWQMLQHVVNHGTYHRGQVAAMLRQLGAKPIATDLIFFYRERASQAKA